jgi:pimeloyl-ACP methyl ester carboxylesterase
MPGPALVPFIAVFTAFAQPIAVGTIVDDVKCLAEPSQSYALYVPSRYTPDRAWPVLFAFHPAARGRAMVEKYAAAAEQYGFIVAASNNSRNGPWELQRAAVAAMPADVGRRFPVDPKRVYLTGMSGGSRVALELALAKNDIAGVIASSAGYPDSQPRARLAFPIFGTAGTEDFNYLEMRLLDRRLSTPHYLAIFEGGHTLPPDSVALEAIEWMELQAMKSGRRARDEALIDRLLRKRRDAIAASTSDAGTVHLLDALVADFQGLRDVAAEAARAKTLTKRADVRKAIDRERAADDEDWRTVNEIIELERALGDSDQRASSLLRLRGELATLSRAANAAEDTPARSRARRLLRMITAGASERVDDREYRAILDQYRK